MNTVSVTRRFRFESAHRLMNHEGKCKHLHGHSYQAFVTCTVPKLNSQGMVIDFSVIKEEVGNWIDNNWDHNTILHPDDDLFYALVPPGHKPGSVKIPMLLFGYAGEGKELEKLNPTAENLARVLFRVAQVLLDTYKQGITVTQVDVQETENCTATYKE